MRTNKKEGQVYVRPFPDVQSDLWKISTARGQTPAWSADGKELFYAATNGFMAVSVTTSPSFSAGKPKLLFDGPYLLSGPGRNYDLSSDGQRFLMIKLASGSGELDAQPEIVVVLNWFEELKRLVPTDK